MKGAVMCVAIKIPQPPQQSGNVMKDIRNLYTFLFQLVQILNKNMEEKEDVRKTS